MGGRMQKITLGKLGKTSTTRVCCYARIAFGCMFFFLFVLTCGLQAQTTSTISGTVRDKQGLVVSGAVIQVSSSELAVDRSTTTESDGAYNLAGSPPGTYG